MSAPNADFGSRWYDNVVIDTEILESSVGLASKLTARSSARSQLEQRHLLRTARRRLEKTAVVYEALLLIQAVSRTRLSETLLK